MKTKILALVVFSQLVSLSSFAENLICTGLVKETTSKGSTAKQMRLIYDMDHENKDGSQVIHLKSSEFINCSGGSTSASARAEPGNGDALNSLNLKDTAAKVSVDGTFTVFGCTATQNAKYCGELKASKVSDSNGTSQLEGILECNN